MDFYIMNRDECVAKWENRQFTMLKKDFEKMSRSGSRSAMAGAFGSITPPVWGSGMES